MAQTSSEQSVSADAFTEEIVLRLVHVQAMLRSVEYDDDGDPQVEHLGGLFSALDYALRGDHACVEPEEFDEERRRALAAHGDYLGLGCRS